MNGELVINEGKMQNRMYQGKCYARWAIKTPLITQKDDLWTVVEQYAVKHLQQGDVLFLSEKMVACTQGRAIALKAIKPSRLGTWLSGFVRKSEYGIGLAMPETMTMAIVECGRVRILLAAAIGAVGRLLHQKGWFYRVAGRKAAAIDGPCPNTIAPYNECVVLAPTAAGQTAKTLAARLEGIIVLIVDINDLGGEILAASVAKSHYSRYSALLADNPLGQSREQTPMGIIRLLDAEEDDKL